MKDWSVKNSTSLIEMCESLALVVFTYLHSPHLSSAGNSKTRHQTVTTKVTLSSMKIILSNVIPSLPVWEIFRREETQLYTDSTVTLALQVLLVFSK